VTGAEHERDAALEAVRSALGAIREIGDSQAKIDASGQFARDLRDGSDEAAEIREKEVLAVWRAESLTLAELARRLGVSKTRAHQIIQAAQREQGVTPKASTRTETIVAAIVTSSKGVLVGRRIDARPLWTFIAGEHIEGETFEETAVREVVEETGLEVVTAETIGERKHPRTHRWMTYIAATPVSGTDAIVGDADELAEVRWVSLEQADMLMGGTIFEPVHEYLRRTLER
jgi:8-oxo-dGTP pyrophosphatase MutT (NUDIX family)